MWQQTSHAPRVHVFHTGFIQPLDMPTSTPDIRLAPLHHRSACRRYRGSIPPLVLPDGSQHRTAVADVRRHEQVAHQKACCNRRPVLPPPIFIGLLEYLRFRRGERRLQKTLEPLRRFSAQSRRRSGLRHVRVELIGGATGKQGKIWVIVEIRQGASRHAAGCAFRDPCSLWTGNTGSCTACVGNRRRASYRTRNSYCGTFGLRTVTPQPSGEVSCKNTAYLTLCDLGREAAVVAVVDSKEAGGAGLELRVGVTWGVQAGHDHVSVFLCTERCHTRCFEGKMGLGE